MKQHLARGRLAIVLAVAASAFLAHGLGVAAAQSGIEEEVSEQGVAPKLALTPAQRSAIYQEVHKDKSKVAPSRFAAHVGAEVPPMIELYMLPDDSLARSTWPGPPAAARPHRYCAPLFVPASTALGNTSR